MDQSWSVPFKYLWVIGSEFKQSYEAHDMLWPIEAIHLQKTSNIKRKCRLNNKIQTGATWGQNLKANDSRRTMFYSEEPCWFTTWQPELLQDCRWAPFPLPIKFFVQVNIFFLTLLFVHPAPHKTIIQGGLGVRLSERLLFTIMNISIDWLGLYMYLMNNYIIRLLLIHDFLNWCPDLLIHW